jgi:hypothetical protein
LIEQISSASPSTLRAACPGSSPLDLSSLNTFVPQSCCSIPNEILDWRGCSYFSGLPARPGRGAGADDHAARDVSLEIARELARNNRNPDDLRVVVRTGDGAIVCEVSLKDAPAY